MTDEQMERLTPERLAEIRYRCERYHSAGWKDMYAVLAELDALRNELEQERRRFGKLRNFFV